MSADQRYIRVMAVSCVICGVDATIDMDGVYLCTPHVLEAMRSQIREGWGDPAPGERQAVAS